MSLFTQGMNLASQPAMDQMAETIWLHGSVPLQGIFDPVEQSTSRTPGGQKLTAETVIYISRFDVSHNNIKKGDKITLQHEGGRDGTDLIKVRIQGIHDDGTNLISLSCGALAGRGYNAAVLAGAIPRR
jgi:hypothetical protein